MNLLVSRLPISLSIEGRQYKVRKSFRDCLRIMLAFEDSELTKQEQQVIMLSNLYYIVPENIEQATIQANWFLNGGIEGTSSKAKGPRVYSFTKDYPMIFAAFLQLYGLDLTVQNLHWWQFIALFQTSISQDSAFGSLVSLRFRLKTGKATKEEREVARTIPDLIEVPEYDTRTLEEKEAERNFHAYVAEGKRRRKERESSL